jgi:hypothetical protein
MTQNPNDFAVWNQNRKLSCQITEALGLDPGAVSSIKIVLTPGEPVKAQVEINVTNKQVQEIEDILSK